MVEKPKTVKGTAQKIGNPPKHPQFGRGTASNPKGRPRGSKNLSTYLVKRFLCLRNQRSKEKRHGQKTKNGKGHCAKGR